MVHFYFRRKKFEKFILNINSDVDYIIESEKSLQHLQLKIYYRVTFPLLYFTPRNNIAVVILAGCLT